MTMDLGKLLEESGAVLRGHFLLTSGRHSDLYLEKFRILEKPSVLGPLCEEIANAFRGQVDAVAGPTTGGIIIAFEVARRLGVDAVYVETENGVKTLRRGKTLEPGARILVVDDVLTTGRSVFEVLEVIRNAGADPIGVGVLIDRSEAPVDFGMPLHAAYRAEATSYPPDAVPDWLAAIPVRKPGTRAV